MSNTLSDHQESEHFSYSRTWEEIEVMLQKAENLKNKHEVAFISCRDSGKKKRAIFHARNIKALEGVIKTLRWTLGDMNVEHPLN